MAEKRPRSPKSAISPPPTRRKVASTTTSTAVLNFFKPASKKDPEQLQWRILDNSLIIGKYAVQESQTTQSATACKIAAFDLDDTLIKSTAGKFTKSATGWKWWDPRVPDKLKELVGKGYQIVILTNQSAISLKNNPKSLQKDKASYRNFKDQLTAVLRQLNLPISVFAATERDKYRKPREGMWKEMLEELDLDEVAKIDLVGSFFVGDAAGRDKSNERPKDHSSCDRDLAANIGIGFHTPEEFFLDHAPEPFNRAFDPISYLCTTKDGQSCAFVFQKTNDLDIVLFCGSPGAGKSTFYWRHLKPLDYERISQDQLKTMNPEKRAALPAAAFKGYASRYQEPTLKEGYQDIIQVDFQVRHLLADFLSLG
ncbi:MAG: hypothetical protein Q9160_004446 [Pyrenula sp. 1 TL-2023]